MIEQKIYEDYVAAMKNREKEKAGFLSFLRAQLKNAAIETRSETLGDEKTLEVLQKQKKRLQETIESVQASGRDDLRQEAERELEFLSAYLPEPLSEEEIRRIVDEVVQSTGASSMKDMGRVMKEILPRTGARADAKEISLLVRQKLSS
ncbi:MAG: GatB/YqeY domain-containing protein [Candidatus Omnitrophica bacterium]|nr:GatB/YqeY domain-containing protein [Candidatus Omnitrophota bacterium]